MSENDAKNIKVKEFFKRTVVINEIDEILNFKPDTLIGIDQVSSDVLIEHNIKNLEQLADLQVDNLPDIKEIPSSILIKWIKIAQVIVRAIKEQLKSHKKFRA